jgi:hypothetical protein
MHKGEPKPPLPNEPISVDMQLKQSCLATLKRTGLVRLISVLQV